MKTAFLFPGQGSQEVGMGQDLAAGFPSAARTFEEADDTLGIPLSRIAWEGPDEELRLTHNAQPALLAHSIAVLRTIHDRLEAPTFVAGHSLGEFTAHVAAGTLTFEAALRAVRLRGELMLQAGIRRRGTMAAVVGLEADVVEGLCRDLTNEDEVCVLANYNTRTQLVISGTPEGVAQVSAAASACGALKIVALNVSGAFHSPLMAEAADGLSSFLDSVPFNDPSVPVVTNVTASAVVEGGEAKKLLVSQLTSPVRWSHSVQFLVEQGVTHCLEIGQGRVLMGILRRVDRSIECVPVQSPVDLPAWLNHSEEVGEVVR